MFLVFNLAFVTAGIALFILLTRPDVRRRCCSARWSARAGLVYFYILSGMQESFHQFLALPLAAALAVLVARADCPPWARAASRPRSWRSSLIRMTWIFLAFPVLLLGAERTWRAVILAGLGTLALMAVVIGLTSGFYSPYRTNFLSETLRESSGAWRGRAACRRGNRRPAAGPQHWGQHRVLRARRQPGDRGGVQIAFLVAALAAWLVWLARRGGAAWTARWRGQPV